MSLAFRIDGETGALGDEQCRKLDGQSRYTLQPIGFSLALPLEGRWKHKDRIIWSVKLLV